MNKVGKSTLYLLPLFFLGFSVVAKYRLSDLYHYETAKEKQIRNLRAAEISELRLTLGKRLEKERRADLYLRLSETYYETYQQLFILEGRHFENRLSQNKKDGVIDRTNSKPYLKRALEACLSILKAKLKYSKLDHVYYLVAIYYNELETYKEAEKYYRQLVERFPKSKFAPDAYRALGDYAYGNRRFKESSEYFEKAADGLQVDDRATVYHKLAWAYYRQRKTNLAIQTMKKAIAEAMKSKEKFLAIKDEALRDMAVFMTESADVKDAYQYFKGISGDQKYFPRVLEKLGEHYERNAKPEWAVRIYDTLLKTDPSPDVRFRVLAKLSMLDLNRRRYRQALSRLESIKAIEDDSAKTETVKLQLRILVRSTAVRAHETYRKLGTRNALRIAARFYEVYLNLFLQDKDPKKEIPEIQMYLAEVYRELGRPRDAAIQYKKIIDGDENPQKKSASALLLVSLGEAIKQELELFKGKPRKNSNEPSESEKDYIKAAKYVADKFPTDKSARISLLRAAQVYAGYSETFDEAIDVCEKIVEKWPATTEAITAGKLWIQIYSDQLTVAKDNQRIFEAIIKTTDTLKNNSGLVAYDRQKNDGKFLLHLSMVATKARLGQIDQQEKARDFGSAALGYLAFAKTASNRRMSEAAYANAAQSYFEAKKFDEMRSVFDEWNEKHKNSNVLNIKIKELATQLLILGNLDESAASFRQLALISRTEGSYLTAARVYAASGQADKSITVYKAFLQKFDHSRNKPSVYLTMAQVLIASDQVKEAENWLKECMKSNHVISVQCEYELAELFEKSGQKDEEHAVLESLAKRTVSSPFVGYARFRIAQEIEENVDFSPLEFPVEKLKVGLDERIAFFEKMSKAYESSVKAGGPWALSSLERIGFWAWKFYLDFKKIEPHKELSQQGKKQFDSLIRSISEPQKKKAISTWQKAYQLAVSQEIFSLSIPKLHDRLVVLKVKGYHRGQGAYLPFEQSGEVPSLEDGVRNSALEQVRVKLAKKPSDASLWVDYGNYALSASQRSLATLAYERALELNPKLSAAQNNLGLLEVLSGGRDEPLQAMRAVQWFLKAATSKREMNAGKQNKTILQNYYRVFKPVVRTLSLIPNKILSAEGLDLLATAEQGSGNLKSARDHFRKATLKGSPADRFAVRYHLAAQVQEQSDKGAVACLSELEVLKESALKGFEKTAVERLRRHCQGTEEE